MGDMKGSKLQHIMRLSWESEQMPGWGDSLSVILETTKKEFQIKNKDATQKNMGIQLIEHEVPVLEEEFSRGR